MRQHTLHVRLLVLVLLLTLSCLAAACDSGNGNSGSETSSAQEGIEETAVHPETGESAEVNGSKEEAKSNKRIKIGFSMDGLQEERWQRDRDMFKEAAEALGAEVVVKAANGDDAMQISQAETMISEGVDILVIVPHNADATAAIVQKAHASGIKVLAYDRLVKNSEIDLYVSFDNEQVGELQARAITRLVPKGKYVYIGGADTDNNAHMFKKGVFNVLQPLIDRGDITIVYDQWSKDWTPANALANMKAALSANGNNIDAVIAANDGTAGGVVQALGLQGMAGKIPVAGQDGDLAAAQRIVEGTQVMTVYKPIRLLAEKAAELAFKLARGEPSGADRKVNNGKIEVPSVLLSPIAVDRFNIDDTIIADGFHSREEVYRNVKAKKEADE
ncbi:D-xylose ABC transporter substrate-binding protein [Paenibacillus sp. CCS19]|uniref:D-xylose ABC transporter substrate-binding protein n=1 Tax=Paenibacillus sp. CCS19 TaxID=3158387 RepID=UPI002560657F|nr:D-xylose ABC transporter substrate-binding protein [Paenibacillus cellulosilyticus]GMK42603.1 D-xylose ABC transporter substrate-binding protein [Paenibacillus cellulosilyticus]